MLIACIRHASTEWNATGRMQGRRDIALSPAGRDELTRWRLPAGLHASCDWIASPLCRAVDTATALRGRPPRVEPALIEMDWGAWEGCRLADLRAAYGDAFTRNEQRGLDFRPPGGESPRDVIARVERWLATQDAGAEPIVSVTHNGVLRALLAIATGWDMTGKPPVKLRAGMLHRFALGAGGGLALVECNVALASGFSEPNPALPASRPPAPSATPP
jgi:2,3-bisphosphoglycerate-dependent phosphoglycerate mutase